MIPIELEKRVYKNKRPLFQFFCPLCRVERSFIYKSHLTPKNYLQLALFNACLIYSTYPILQGRAFIWVFLTWGVMEVAVKILHRRDIPCPHCGFDATWYKRDVTKANSIVKDFWQRRELADDDKVEDREGQDISDDENGASFKEAPGDGTSVAVDDEALEEEKIT